MSEWILSAKEVVRHQKRVLRFVDGFLSKENQTMLITNGRSLMTYAEVRSHIKAALKLEVRRARKAGA